MKNLLTLFLLILSTSVIAQLTCTDCPNTVFIDGILTSEMEVVSSGSDDISQNPLQKVCLTIQHSWLSDLVVSLESPDGLHYTLMGDENNNWNECEGAIGENVDVCFVLGNDNPLTNGVSYGNFCTGTTNPCLDGDYTLACGDAAHTPDSLAYASPNCDINDFNVPGNSIGGIWKLRVYCVCQAEIFGSALIMWSLHFQDNSVISTTGGLSCIAYGGYGPIEPGGFICNNLNIEFTPTNGGLGIPNGNGYGYGKIAVLNNTIYSTALTNEMTVENWPQGFYEIYGVSYNDSSMAQLMSYNGSSLDELLASQGDDDFHCYSLSSNSRLVIIEEGEYTYTEEIYPMICPGESFSLTAIEEGISYLWTGPNGFTSSNQSIVISNPDESDSGTYSCEITSFNSGCQSSQITEVSFRCEDSVLEIYKGDQISLEFEEVVATGDQCQDANENIATIGMTSNNFYIWGQNVGTELVCFQAYENGLLKNFTYEVTVLNNPTSSVNEEEVSLDIFPNPAADYIRIAANDINIESASLYDAKGSLVRTIAINDSSKNIDISSLPKGLYLIKIEIPKGSLTSRFIVE